MLYKYFLLFAMFLEAEVNRQNRNEMYHCYLFPLVRIAYQVSVWLQEVFLSPSCVAAADQLEPIPLPLLHLDQAWQAEMCLVLGFIMSVFLNTDGGSTAAIWGQNNFILLMVCKLFIVMPDKQKKSWGLPWFGESYYWSCMGHCETATAVAMLWLKCASDDCFLFSFCWLGQIHLLKHRAFQ